MSSTTPSSHSRLSAGIDDSLGKEGGSRPALFAQGRRGEEARKEDLMGVYRSLWLLGSISSTSRSYDTKLLESKQQGEISPAKHITLCLFNRLYCAQSSR